MIIFILQMHLHSFVLTRLPIYISLAVNYFQKKIIFSGSANTTGRGGDLQVKFL